ncbi:MAG: hypothetical protein Q9180_005733 [Flavoplaca navasiana]
MLGTDMVTAFQHPTTRPGTNMFGLDVVLKNSRGTKWSQFAFNGLSLECFALARTTTLPTLVSATVERRFTGS